MEGALAVGVRAAWSPAQCAAWSAAVLAARGRWTSDFSGEQFSLGRAFYTHLETDRAREYFASAPAADALVEATLPGMQTAARELLGALVGGVVTQRVGWCGAGVHVFLPQGTLARRGGAVHFDVEGLTPLQLAQRSAALALVLMLQPPERGGGLRLWDARYRGREEPTAAERRAPSVRASYGAGDALLFEAWRLHQIQRFSGETARLSVTLLAAQTHPGRWECWF